MKYSPFLFVLGIFLVTSTTPSGAFPSEEKPETTPEPDGSDHPSNADRDITLMQIARLPVTLNTTVSAFPCSPECGSGPQLACPKDGDCGAGKGCCFDKCRKRQVCRPSSEAGGSSKIVKRETEYETEDEYITNDDDDDDAASNDYSSEYTNEEEPNFFPSSNEFDTSFFSSNIRDDANSLPSGYEGNLGSFDSNEVDGTISFPNNGVEEPNSLFSINGDENNFLHSSNIGDPSSFTYANGGSFSQRKGEEIKSANSLSSSNGVDTISFPNTNGDQFRFSNLN